MSIHDHREGPIPINRMSSDKKTLKLASNNFKVCLEPRSDGVQQTCEGSMNVHVVAKSGQFKTGAHGYPLL